MMREASRWVVTVCVGLVLAAATLLLSPDTELGTASAESEPPLSWLAAVITIPVRTVSSADLRYYVLPIGLAALLLIAAASSEVRTLIARVVGWSAASHDAASGRNVRWFAIVSAATVCWASASALAGETWELSSGWIFLHAVGCGWAVLLAALIDARCAVRILIAGVIVAAAATAATFWHRHVLGILHVRWPVGPITLTAELGAVWAVGAVPAAVAAAHALALRRARTAAAAALAAAALALVVGLLMLDVSARRSAWLGAAAGWGFGAVVLLARSRRRAWHAAGALGVVASVILAGFYVASQARSAQREVAGPLAVRFALWRHILDRLPGDWALGAGPDMFTVTSTNDLARDRAEMPHVLHGDLETAAHNEWLQAVHELGVPGGLMVLALPVGVIIACVRAQRATGEGSRRAVLAIVAMSLSALVVTETSSVNLRYPTMPAWYWTLLGVCLALLRGDSEAPAPAPAWLPRVGVLRLAAVGLAAALAVFVSDDLRCNAAHAEARTIVLRDPARAAEMLEIAHRRFGAKSWLAAQFDLGAAQSAVVRNLQRARPTAQPDAHVLAGQQSWTAAAAATWRGLYARCPGYPGAGGRLAEALLNAGRRDEARSTLDAYVRDVNPYDPQANLLYARNFDLTAVERLQCVKRALRAGELDERVERAIVDALTDPSVAVDWPRQVGDARSDVAARPEAQWRDPLAPELLRIEAARLIAEGDVSKAAETQAAAARACGGLYDANHPHRRAPVAEVDVWFRAADYTWRSDPARWRDAYEFACHAERFAVEAIGHEYLRHADPDGEFVGGVVMPTEAPARLRPMWRLSALLHLVAGREKDRDRRIMLSLPDVMWGSEPALRNAVRELASEAVAAFGPLPTSERPPSYERLVSLARS